MGVSSIRQVACGFRIAVGIVLPRFASPLGHETLGSVICPFFFYSQPDVVNAIDAITVQSSPEPKSRRFESAAPSLALNGACWRLPLKGSGVKS